MNPLSVRRYEPLILLFAAGLFLIAGCTTTAAVEERPEDTVESRTPSWFPEDGGVVEGDSTLDAYGSALAGDSAGSAAGGVVRARMVLENHLSFRLETIRREAVAEGGEGSGLDRPRFILALRKAERSLSGIGQAARGEVRQTGAGSWRSFSEVTIEKSTLVRQLDRQLAAVAESWNRMKESSAFLRL